MTKDEFRAAFARLAKERGVSLLITVDAEGRAVPRPMGDLRVDDDLTVWYATGASSRKCAHIATNPKVTVYWQNPGEGVGGWQYAWLYGAAEVLTDQATKDAFWNDSIGEYFPGGSTDPNYAVIKITPTRIEGVLGGEFETEGFHV